MSTATDSPRHARRRLIVAVLMIAAGTVPVALPGQQARRMTVTVMAGVGLTSPLVVDGNGTTVRLGLAPTISAQLSSADWRLGPVHGGIVARLASASLRLRDGRERWAGGRLWQSDLLATAAVPLAGGRAKLTAGGGIVRLRASRSISPLEHTVISPAAEVTLAARASSSQWGMAVTAQGYRLRPSVGRAGGVARLVAGVTHDF